MHTESSILELDYFQIDFLFDLIQTISSNDEKICISSKELSILISQTSFFSFLFPFWKKLIPSLYSYYRLFLSVAFDKKSSSRLHNRKPLICLNIFNFHFNIKRYNNLSFFFNNWKLKYFFSILFQAKYLEKCG